MGKNEVLVLCQCRNVHVFRRPEEAPAEGVQQTQKCNRCHLNVFYTWYPKSNPKPEVIHEVQISG